MARRQQSKGFLKVYAQTSHVHGSISAQVKCHATPGQKVNASFSPHTSSATGFFSRYEIFMSSELSSVVLIAFRRNSKRWMIRVVATAQIGSQMNSRASSERLLLQGQRPPMPFVRRSLVDQDHLPSVSKKRQDQVQDLMGIPVHQPQLPRCQDPLAPLYPLSPDRLFRGPSYRHGSPTSTGSKATEAEVIPFLCTKTHFRSTAGRDSMIY